MTDSDSKTTNQYDEHKLVSEAYGSALKRAKERATSCCGGATPKGAATGAAGSAAQLVDYAADSEGLEEVLASSFGCGNPLAFSGVQEGQTVLDLGCGAGLDLLIAAKRVGESGRVIGVDMTDEMVAEARCNIERAKADNIKVRKGLIEELPVDSNSVDWVISNCVLNLSPDKGAVFSEIARVLRPGGQFSVSDIVVEDLPEELRNHAALRSACIGGAISEGDYVGGLERAGLDQVEVVERLMYDKDQLLCVVSLDDAVAEGLTPEFMEAAAAKAAGKVWSAKITGRKS